MTERGLPIVDGAPACPFVAFEDDRDERAASPDHRHRCYAEAQPAPRALAHQEAYCLSSAFPVCPTFQDWARREAARSRLDAPAPRSMDSVAAAALAANPQRNPPRDWSAPPPWAGRGGSGGSPDGAWGEDDEAAEGPDVPPQGRGLSGSFADRVASEPGMSGAGGDPDPDLDPDEADEPIGEVPPYVPPAPPVAPQAAASPPRQESGQTGAWDDEDAVESDAEPEPQRRRRERDPEVGAGLGGGGRVGGGGSGGDGGGGPRPVRRRDRDAPEWERSRPMEAYPTLRSRRLPELSIPPILVAVVALAIAAAVLFALPGLLGFGGPSSGESANPTVPIATELITPAPTPVPQPTDQFYLVAAGDTMSSIAKRFGIALDELIAANAETIPNPNKL